MSSPTDTDAAVDPTLQEEKTRLNLEVSVQAPNPCQRHVTVMIPREDIERYFGEEYDKIMPEAQVPGFRPGRAPRKLVESHFRKEIARQIKGRLILDCVTQVTEDQSFSAISEPDFDYEAVEVPDDGPMKFEFDIEVRPEFELPQWRGLKIERPTRTIGKEEIDQQLQLALERFATLEPIDEPAQLNDFVTFRANFNWNGKRIREAESLTARVRKVLSFQDGNLEGFDELAVGAKPGDQRTATITLSPESESAELRGEVVDVDLEILEVKRLSLPQLDQQVLSRLGDFGDEGELRDYIRQELDRRIAYSQNERIRRQITGLLTEAAKWDLPPEMLKRQAQRELERAVMELRSSGFSEEEISVHANTLRQNSMQSTAMALKEHFILERIAEEHEIDASDEDYELEINLISLQSQESPRSVRAKIEKRGLWDALRNQIVERKVIQLIKEHASFVDVPLPPSETTVTAVDFSVGRANTSDIPEAKHGGEEQPLKLPTERG